MYFLSRRPGQSIHIQPKRDLDPPTPAMELFAEAPIVLRVASLKGKRVQLVITSHPGLDMARTERVPPKVTDFLGPDAHLAIAVKMRILMHLRKHTSQSLAVAARLPLDTVIQAERGDGLERFTDLELLAAALKVNTLEFLRPAGCSAEEREVMMELEPAT